MTSRIPSILLARGYYLNINTNDFIPLLKPETAWHFDDGKM